jgi:glutathione S-transferase
MKLYYSPAACSLATNILLREAGLKFDLERVSFADHKTETGADYYQINPKGYVPALKLDDGEIIAENVVLHPFIASLNPDARLVFAPGTKERRKADQLSAFISTEIHKTYSPFFLATPLPEDAKPLFREKLLKRYALIEDLLSDGRPYLTGQTFQTVDSYLFTVTRWAPHVGLSLAKFPKVLAFQDRVAARPAVIAALQSEGLLQKAA